MNTLSHQGYTAHVEYDERDGIFVGRVLGIGSIISFHAESVAGLRGEFEAALDDYLAECREDGITPEKPVPEAPPLRVCPEAEWPLPPRGQSARLSIGG